MASKHGWSAGLDLTDVAMNIVGFEVMNNVKIALVMTVEDREGVGEVYLTATALPRQLGSGAVKPLASVRSSCYSMNVKSLEAAVIHILYLLDGKLGSVEMRKGS